MFRALGRTRLELVRDFGILMPRLEASCRFRSPARAEEVLSVGIAVLELTERRIKYAFEAHERDLQRLVCEGSYRVACVSRQHVQAARFPARHAHADQTAAGDSSPNRRPRAAGPGRGLTVAVSLAALRVARLTSALVRHAARHAD